MQNDDAICSGATPQQVAADLQALVDFQEEGMPLPALERLVGERLLPHLMRYDRPNFQSMFNAFPEPAAEWGGRIALAYNQGVTNWQVSPGAGPPWRSFAVKRSAVCLSCLPRPMPP